MDDEYQAEAENKSSISSIFKGVLGASAMWALGAYTGTQWQNSDQVQVVDVNRDGREDIVVSSSFSRNLPFDGPDVYIQQDDGSYLRLDEHQNQKREEFNQELKKERSSIDSVVDQVVK